MHFKFLQFHETSPQSLQMFQQLTSPHQTFSDKMYLYFAPRDIREHTDADFYRSRRGSEMEAPRRYNRCADITQCLPSLTLSSHPIKHQKRIATNPFGTTPKAVETSQHIALDDPTDTGVLTCVLHSGSKPGKDNNNSSIEVIRDSNLVRARTMNRTPRKLSMLKRCFQNSK
jgi:hypothetical protein